MIEAAQTDSLRYGCWRGLWIIKAMKADSWEQIDRFWAQELGLDSGLAGTPGLLCTVQQRYSGVRLFSNGERLVIAAPPAKAEFIREAIFNVSAEDAFSVEWLSCTFADDAERILGPAEVAYADETSFRTELNHGGRALSASDSATYRQLVAELESEVVEETRITADTFPAFGAFSGDTLCSVASYEVWEPAIAQIRVATHPSYRRRGFARSAVQALAAAALDRGLILQWRALASNQNSLALARSLGFNYYGSTLYVRLRNP